MANQIKTRPQYDLPTAVTFLLAGLALGTVVAVVFSPLKEKSELSSIAQAGNETRPSAALRASVSEFS